jgi:LysR family transcriptional regulator, regulator for metE and metH
MRERARVNLELRHLRIVRTIATSGTTTAAAAEIGITQSALSQQLIDLEERLAERLFQRTARRMVLTAFGERFLARARTVLDEAARMEAWLAQSKVVDPVPLRISTDNVLTLRWLPQVLARFRELHPNAGVRILRTPQAMNDLVAGRLDIAVTFPQKPPHPAIEMVALFDDEMVAVLPPGHALARKRVVSAADLDGADFLYHMELGRSALWRRFLEPQGIRFASETVIEQTEAIVELVSAGLGVSIVPRASVTRESESGTVILRPLSPKRRGYRIAWSAAVRRERGSPWVDEMVRLFREAGSGSA